MEKIGTAVALFIIQMINENLELGKVNTIKWYPAAELRKLGIYWVPIMLW